jgi:hypothetical protein
VDTVFRWDGAPQRLARGTVLDVPPGSALLAAIGPQNLAPLGAKAAQPAPEAIAEVPPQGNGRSRKSAAKNGNEGEGQS